MEVCGEVGELARASGEGDGGIDRGGGGGRDLCGAVMNQEMECGALGGCGGGGVKRDGADEDGLGGVVRATLQGLPAAVPKGGVGEVETGAGREGEVEIGGLALEMGGGGAEDVAVPGALPGCSWKRSLTG